MKFLKKLTTSLKRKSHAERSSSFGVFGNPDTDWKVLLVFFFVALALVLVLSIALFMKLNGRKTSATASENVRVETINRDTLGGVLEDFKNLESRFESIKEQAPNIGDPSR